MSENETAGLGFARLMQVHARALITSDDELLAAARARALDPAVFDEYPPYFFGGEISSTRWDAYDTRMGLSTLRNFAADAETGVAYLRAHVNREDPTGGTLRGRFEDAGDGGVARALADFYVPLTPANAEHVARIKAGVVRDLSVGFYGGEWMCSICGKDMLDWLSRDGCRHLLGFTYTPRDEAGEPSGDPVKARATIENAHLAEVSGVYDGATPGAMIQKARAMAAEGVLDAAQRDLVQVRYRIHLPGTARPFGGATLQSGHAADQRAMDAAAAAAFAVGDRVRVAIDTPHMPGQSTGTVREAVATWTYGVLFDGMEEMGIHHWYVESELTAADQAEGAMTMTEEAMTDGQSGARAMIPTDEALVRLLTARSIELTDGETPVTVLERILNEADGLRSLADDGRAYRADLVAEALAEGVRAYGAGFAEETYERMLKDAPLDVIKRMRDDWRTIGDQRLPGGRATTEESEADTTAARETETVPAHVFKA